jgi:WD40 repeat protein
MYVRSVVLCSLAISLPSFSVCSQQATVTTERKLPQPSETIQDSRQFNALRFGPGNTFAVEKRPPDFDLNAFALSTDGRLIAMGWASGRIELRDVPTKSKVREFKSGLGAPQILQFNSSSSELVATGSGGKIVFLHIPDGKKVREWRISLGKYKYDLQDLVLDPQEKWLAYADEENSKVLDLTTGSPQTLADLGDAGSLALSQDGTELWAMDRSKFERFSTATWKPTGQWPLKSEPQKTSSTVVRSGVGPGGKESVAIPSAKGLVIYRDGNMEGEYVTHAPTSRAAFAPGINAYIDFSRDLTLLDGTGSTLCKMSYQGSHDYAVSGDGQWLALSQDASVDLWRLEDIIRDCDDAQRSQP